MEIMKSLKLIFRFKPKGAKRTKMESMRMAQERFVSHLQNSLKGHARRAKYSPAGVGSPKMDRRLAQSKMDWTRHVLNLERLKLQSMA